MGSLEGGKIYSRCLLALAALGALTACDPDIRRMEIASEVSPDGRMRAVLYRELGGPAVVGVYYALYLTEHNEAEDFSRRQFLARYVEGVSLSWNERVLTVSYTKGRISDVDSNWRSLKDDYYVEVRLDPKCTEMCF